MTPSLATPKQPAHGIHERAALILSFIELSLPSRMAARSAALLLRTFSSSGILIGIMPRQSQFCPNFTDPTD